MFIKCYNKKCGRIMGVKEFLVYVSCHLSKYVLPIIVPVLADRLKEYWELPTRDWIDESMTAYANFIALQCPGCDKTKWDPYIYNQIKEFRESNSNIIEN